MIPERDYNPVTPEYETGDGMNGPGSQKIDFRDTRLLYGVSRSVHLITKIFIKEI